MRKIDLQTAVDAHVAATREALQLIWDNTNKGQRRQLLKNPASAALLERYGVVTGAQGGRGTGSMQGRGSAPAQCALAMTE